MNYYELIIHYPSSMFFVFVLPIPTFQTPQCIFSCIFLFLCFTITYISYSYVFFLFLCFQFLRSKQALNMSTKRHKKIIVNMLEDTKLIIIFSFLMGSHVK